MISATDTMVCARCRERKAVEQFRPNVNMRSGRHSWCIHCSNDYTRQRSVYRTRSQSPANTKIAKSLQSGDPVDYSRAVCEHVAWYVQRKITEFEALHQKEAPPHMTSILAIADSMLAQHPAKERPGSSLDGTYDLVCQRCGEPFAARSPTGMYCAACKPLIRRERRQSPIERALRAAQKRDARARKIAEKPPLLCQRCAKTIEGATTQARKYCDSCRAEVVAEYRRDYRKRYRQTEVGRDKRRRERRAWKQRRRAKQHVL